MNALVLEHVPVSELPEAWRARLAHVTCLTVTVRIEPAVPAAPPAKATTSGTEDPAFGIWRDREDMTDVQTVVRSLREPRHVQRIKR